MRAEEELRNSARRYRTLFESVNDSILLMNGEHFTDCNTRTLSILRCAREQVIGQTFHWLSPERQPDGSDSRESIEQAIRAALQGKPQSFEWKTSRHDGSLFDAEVSLTCIEPSDGRQLFAIIRQISNRKQAEQELLSEKQLSEDYINSLPGLFYVFDERRFVKWNNAWEKVTGYSAEELGARYGSDFVQGEDKTLIEDRMMDVFRDGAAEAEAELVTKDGRRIPYFFTGSRREFNGKPHLVGLGVDITQRKRAEKDLARYRDQLEQMVEERTTELKDAVELLQLEVSERKQAQNELAVFKWFSEAAGQALGMAGLDGNITYANAALCRLLGEDTQQDAVGKNVRSYYTERDAEVLEQVVLPMVMSEGQWIGELSLKSSQGRITPCIEAVFLIRDERGEPQYLANVIADISERKQMEDELARHRDHLEELVQERTGELARLNEQLQRDIAQRKQAEEKLREHEAMIRALVETSRDWIWAIDLQGIHTYCNPAIEAILGYRPEEMVADPSLDLIHEEDRKMVEAELPKWIAERCGWNDLALRWKHKDGSYRYLESNAVPIVGASGELTGFRGVDRDITERRNAQQALRESEERLELAQDAAGIGMFDWDIVHDQAICNERYFRLFGLESRDRMLSMEDWLGRIHPDDRERAQREVKQALEENVPYDTEYRVVWPDTSLKWVSSKARVFYDERGRPHRMIGAMSDITERRDADAKLRETEARLAHVSRLSTMGEMMACIGHEVNQPLYAIRNFARATQNALNSPKECNVEELREWNAAIDSAANRAAEILKRIRGFARRGESVHSLCGINEIIQESAQLVAFEARRHEATTRLELPEPSPMVHVDRIQIQQVLVNLLRNAFEAMDEPANGVREATIQVESTGESIEVSVADTGPGLPSHSDVDIFQPFGTTKQQGLGMGLAISSTILEAHHGRLWANSAPERGAIFRFALPAYQEEPADVG